MVYYVKRVRSALDQARKAAQIHDQDMISASILKGLSRMEQALTYITEFISNVGFPIACCGALFWYVNKRDERHYQELESLKSTVAQNSEILKELKLLISAFIQKEND